MLKEGATLAEEAAPLRMGLDTASAEQLNIIPINGLSHFWNARGAFHVFTNTTRKSPSYYFYAANAHQHTVPLAVYVHTWPRTLAYAITAELTQLGYEHTQSPMLPNNSFFFFALEIFFSQLIKSIMIFKISHYKQMKRDGKIPIAYRLTEIHVLFINLSWLTLGQRCKPKSFSCSFVTTN